MAIELFPKLWLTMIADRSSLAPTTQKAKAMNIPPDCSETEPQLLLDEEAAVEESDPSLEDPTEYIRFITDHLDADIYVYSGDLDFYGANAFVDLVRRYHSRSRAALVLTTWGGQADAAYKIARYLRRVYGEFTLYVFGYCKSAGTLLALGASEIVMSHVGEFGPLDVQITKPDDIVVSSSGLDIAQALDSLSQTVFNMFERHFLAIKRRSGGSITTRTAGEIAGTLAVGMLSPITAQIDPLRIGETYRAINIARDYGRRLAGDNRKVSQLIGDYPSHSFVIDYDEACEVFGNVREPTVFEDLLDYHALSIFDELYKYNVLRIPASHDPLIVLLSPQIEPISGEAAEENEQQSMGVEDENHASSKGREEHAPDSDQSTEEPEIGRDGDTASASQKASGLPRKRESRHQQN